MRLNDDILRIILNLLDDKDWINFRMTCQRIYYLPTNKDKLDRAAKIAQHYYHIIRNFKKEGFELCSCGSRIAEDWNRNYYGTTFNLDEVSDNKDGCEDMRRCSNCQIIICDECSHGWETCVPGSCICQKCFIGDRSLCQVCTKGIVTCVEGSCSCNNCLQ